MNRTVARQRQPVKGQAIVLVALLMTLLLAMAGLAIDISLVYATQRQMKAVADASSLAGGQDLQQPNTRVVTNAHRTRAREHSLTVLAARLGDGTIPTGCNTAADIVRCAIPGSDYLVSIHTPSRSCVDCVTNRAVQVTIERPDFGLFFARIVGQTGWRLSAASVAGINNGIRYGVVTLRPPDPNRNNTNDPNNCDVDLSGNNTRVVVANGDIGSNTTVCTSGNLAYIELEAGFHIYHFNVGEPWRTIAGQPPGIRIQRQIDDPLYLSDAQLTAITGSMASWTDQAAGEDLLCANAVSSAPGAIVPTGAKCYRPGIYPHRNPGGAFRLAPGETAFLYPGVYYFAGEVDIQGSLIAGNTSRQDQPNGGVTVIGAKDRAFSSTGGGSLRLNRGPAACSSSACRAGTATAPNGHVMVAPDGTPLTLIVPRWPGCFNGTTPTRCTDTNNDNNNRTLNLQGSGVLGISGILYAPSDQVRVRSDNTTQQGTVGQVIAWTLDYSGGAGLNQAAFNKDTPGILRLDAACTSGEVCSYP